MLPKDADRMELLKLSHVRVIPHGLVVVCSGLSHFQQFFNHIMTVSGYDRELKALFYSAASLKYHAPDT